MMGYPISQTVLLLLLITWKAAAYPSKVRNNGENAVVSGAELERQQLFETVCETAGCKESATSLLQSMDLKADPCHDFFRFSCGQFLKTKEVPDDRASIAVISEMDFNLRKQVRSLLEEEVSDHTREPKPFSLAKSLYRACMNVSVLEKQGISPLKDKLSRYGGWPVVVESQWLESDFDWIELNYKLSQAGLYGDFLFTVTVSYDITNTSRHGIVINMAKLVLDVKGLAPDMVTEMVRGYHSLSADIAVMFGANHTTALKDMMDVVNFELALGEITKSREARRNVYSWLNPMNITTLNDKYPFIPWQEYLSNVLMISKANISDEEVVVVYDKEYMDQLHSVIHRTPKRTVANYMLWRMVMNQLPYLSAEASRRLQDFENSMMGQVKEQRRWERCVKEVQTKMTHATASMYVRRYFTQEAKGIAKEIVESIREEIHNLLESVDWMDDATRQAAMLKATRMQYEVGYPDELLQDNFLEKHYQDLLEVQSDQYLQSILELNKFLKAQTSKQLHVNVNKSSWTAKSDVVNAYYNLAENSLSLPAGILQGAFFAPDRPQYMNYGAVGSAIGHEVTHAFDDRGRLFNMDGELLNWWKEDTQQRFTEKIQCMVEQYGNYTDKQVNERLNGIITQGENIADNAGVKLAYKAYLRFESRQGRELRLPLPVPSVSGQPLSARQLFWVGFATPWCAKYRSKDLRITLKTSPHLPGEYRVNGALSNQDDFSRDFSCPKGSPMNPVKKCQVW